MTTYDHIILGSGQATGTLLGKLISTGDSIAVIEAGKVGGSCVNYGCTPTKALVASAKAIHKARQGDQYGFAAGEVRVDYAAVRERMNRIRGNSRSGLVQWMEDADNVTLIRGHGQFTGPDTLRVGDKELTGRHIYINTGTRPRAPQIAGLGQVPWVDSAGLLNKEELPQHLLIVGGGYIGVEFAQVFRRFGAEVTILQRSDQLMPKEDKDVANTIRDFLQDEGIRVLCNASAQSVVAKNGGIELTVDLPGEQQRITGSDLLIAAGRIPNSDRIGLETAGIETRERGYIQVDDHCRTNVENVFAVGDVNGYGAFTHTSVNDAEIVVDQLFGEGKRQRSDRIMTYALFSDPPLGRVGLSEKEALAQGEKVLVATKPMAEISRAKEMGETTGFAKLLVDGETDLILGAAILGPGGDEIINMFTAIMHSQIPCRDYRHVMLIHPTVSELMPFMLDGIQEAREAEE